MAPDKLSSSSSCCLSITFNGFTKNTNYLQDKKRSALSEAITFRWILQHQLTSLLWIHLLNKMPLGSLMNARVYERKQCSVNYFNDFFTIAYKMSTINPSNTSHLYCLLTLRHFILFYCVFYTFLTFCVKRRKKHEIFAHVSSKRIFYCFNLKCKWDPLHLI